MDGVRQGAQVGRGLDERLDVRGRARPHVPDEVDETGAAGRSWADAPDIDGTVYFRSKRALTPGDIVPVSIERSDAYDLWGQVVD